MVWRFGYVNMSIHHYQTWLTYNLYYLIGENQTREIKRIFKKFDSNYKCLVVPVTEVLFLNQRPSLMYIKGKFLLF